jgi:hypothetical protein
MTDNLDWQIERLSTQPVGQRLDWAEAHIAGRIRGASNSPISLRIAAVGIALAMGIGGGSVAAAKSVNENIEALLPGGRLAPSSLLGLS